MYPLRRRRLRLVQIMSRGPGKWQRMILRALELHKSFFVRDLLPANAGRSACVALSRALRSLELAGRVSVRRWYRTAVMRPGVHAERNEIERINVDDVPTLERCQHLRASGQP